MRTSSRSGSAIIEALVATVLLATAGVALVTLLGQTAHSMRSVRTSERQVRAASEQLDHLVLLDRADLLAKRGETAFGEWALSIDVIESDLFDVSIGEPGANTPLLQTTLYRPDTTNDRQ